MPIDPYTGEEIGDLPRLTVRPNPLPVEAYDAATGMAYPDQPQQDYSAVNPAIARLLGVGEGERFQTWPERMARSGFSLPADVYSGAVPIETEAAAPYAIAPGSNDTIMEPRSIPKALGMGNFTVPNAESAIARVQDTSGMAGMSTIGIKPGTATLGSGAVRKEPVDWNLVGQLERKLSPEASKAIDTWVGGHPDFAKEGGFAGIWSPDKLKEALTNPQIASELEAVMKPIKEQLKAEHGDTIELHRAHGKLPEGAKPDRELLSFTSDREFAEAHGGVSKPKKIFSEAEISKFEKDFAENDKVQIGKNVYLEKGQFGGADLFVGNEHVTGYSNVRDYFNQRRESALEHNAERDNNLKNVYTKQIPIDDIVFVTDRFGQKEFIVKNNGTLFEDSKAATGIGAVNQSGYYSTLERTIANSKVQKGTPEQWQAYLKNQPGIKPEELEFSLSNLPNKQLTKAELEAHVAENGIKLGEVWKGNSNQTALFDRQVEIKNRLEKIQDEFDNLYGQPDSAALAKKRQDLANEQSSLRKEHGEIFNKLKGDVNNKPKFSSYQLPGGENYRELLLTVPKKKTELDILQQKHDDGLITPEETNKLNQLYKTTDIEKPYQSSHWDEPNVLAHIRMNDRVIPSTEGVGSSKLNPEGWHITPPDQTTSGKWMVKSNDYNSKGMHFDTEAEAKAALDKKVPETKGLKTLHIEEIQSDWHQAGRKQGYRPELEKKLEELVKQRDDIVNQQKEILAKYGETIPTGEAREPWAELAIKRDSIQDQIHDLGRGDVGVPNAPFKKTWDELALKRAITEAAHNGYDAVSWTPGEAQAARYDLSKQIERIHFTKTNDGQYLIAPECIGGREVPVNSGQAIPANKLADYIGKEVADKIIKKAEETKPYEPITKLPEGYKLIHDSNGKANGEEWGIIPSNQSHAGSITGRYLPTEEAAVKAALDKINSEKRFKYDRENSVLENVDLKIGGEGMKAFYDTMLPAKANALIKKMGGKVEYHTQKDTRNYSIEPNPANKNGESVTVYSVRDDKNRLMADFPTKEKAEQYIAGRKAGEAEQKGTKIPIIRITPQMREKITKEGFPLYSSGVPSFTPVDDPFKKKEPRLVPVDYNPFTNRNAT